MDGDQSAGRLYGLSFCTFYLAQLPQLGSFYRRQAVSTTAFIQVCLGDPVADRLFVGFKLSGQLTGAAPGSMKLDYLLAKLGWISSSCSWHRVLHSPKGLGVHETGGTPVRRNGPYTLGADRAAFWWNERKPDQPVLWDSKIRLGEDFFNEIIRHPVPLDLNTLTALKRCALGLDLYLWLAYRTFSLRAPLRLSWRQIYRQFGLHPAKASEKRTVQNFRSEVLRELNKIKLAWPELNYSTARGVLILSPSAPAIAPSSDPPRLV